MVLTAANISLLSDRISPVLVAVTLNSLRISQTVQRLTVVCGEEDRDIAGSHKFAKGALIIAKKKKVVVSRGLRIVTQISGLLLMASETAFVKLTILATVDFSWSSSAAAIIRFCPIATYCDAFEALNMACPICADSSTTNALRQSWNMLAVVKKNFCPFHVLPLLHSQDRFQFPHRPDTVSEIKL